MPLALAARIVREAVPERRWGDTPIGEHVEAYLDSLEYAEAAANTLLACGHVLGLFAVEHADLSLADLEPPQGGESCGRSSIATGASARPRRGRNGWR